ncbi:MAG: 30S ribosomal protein S4 [Planctomycetota bacterium]
MSLYLEAKCRLCRREGIKLYLKGQKCFSSKCPVDRRPKPPGQTARGYKRLSEYGIRLREKQKVKRTYGLRERQFKKLFWDAKRIKGNTGSNLLIMLERRLDSILYRSGYALSIPQARQLCSHGHVKVNGQYVYSPSFLVSPGDEITFKEKSIETFKAIKETTKDYISVPAYILILAEDKPRIKIMALPTADDSRVKFNIQYVVEYYTR